MSDNRFTVIGDSRTLNVNFFTFNGGEVSVKVDNPLKYRMSYVRIHAHIINSEGVMSLMMLVDALRRSVKPKCLDLVLPYLPYARQDRVCNSGEALSVKVMCDLINSLHFDSVSVHDCHSDVGVALLDNCTNVGTWELIKDTSLSDLLLDVNSVLVSPDAGANKKTLSLAKTVNEYRGFPIDMIRADKNRNTATGEITETIVYCDDLTDKTVIIIDDICEGGQTFIKLAEKLKEKNVNKVILYVTHGLFTKGLDILFDSGIDAVYTANSWGNFQSPSFYNINKGVI